MFHCTVISRICAHHIDTNVIVALASQIVQNIQSGIWTASAVLEAYIARATYAQATTNCLTESEYASLSNGMSYANGPGWTLGYII